MLTFHDSDSLLEKALELDAKLWRVRVADAPTRNLRAMQGATWAPWQSTDSLEAKLTDILYDLEEKQKFVVVDLKNSSTEKGGSSYAIDFTPKRGGAGLAGIGGANVGIYGANQNIDSIIKRRIEEERYKWDMENRLNDLEAQNQELRKGNGVQGFLAGLVEKVQPSTIDFLIAKVAGAVFDSKQPIIAGGFGNDDHDDQNGDEQEEIASPGEQVNPADAKKAETSKRLIALLNDGQQLLKTDTLGVIVALEKLFKYAKENPTNFEFFLKSIG